MSAEITTAPRRAQAVDLTGCDGASEAFVRIVQECTEHWQVNEAAVLAGRTPENLHQMRVGIRRLRSAFSLFRPVLSAVPAAEIVAHGLRAAALPFGRARDLDVLLSGPLAADLDSAQLDGLRTEREAAYDDVIAILRSPEWGQVRADLDAFVEAAPWGLAADPAPDVLADAALTKRRRRVVKGGADLRALTSHARHEVRIEAKKLRYGSEFFASVYADSGLVVDKPSGTVLTGGFAYAYLVEQVTDSLGQLNDHATAGGLLATVGAQAPSISEDALLGEAQDAITRLAATPAFWV